MESMYLIIALMGALILFLWHNNCQKTRTINQLSSLQTSKDVADLVSAHLHQLGVVLGQSDARTRLHDMLTQQDRLGEMTAISTHGALAWDEVEEIYLIFYKFLFDYDFKKMRTDEELSTLVGFKTDFLHVEDYIAYNPGFKEKCLTIISRNIKLASNYDELVGLKSLALSWEPFKMWADDIDVLFQKQAYLFTKKDMETNRQFLAYRVTISAWGKQELKEVHGIFLQGISILKRNLLTPEDSLEITTAYRDTAKNALDKFIKWADTENIDLLNELKEAFSNINWPVHNMVA